MATNVGAMSKGCERRERAAPWVHVTASQQKELGWWLRGAAAGRPVWSRAVHDRKAQTGNGAFEPRFTASECGRSTRASSRLPPTRAGNQGASRR
jgi:hypothetical protein